eukprot:Gb_09700 [translate_table: standard]
MYQVKKLLELKPQNYNENHQDDVLDMGKRKPLEEQLEDSSMGIDDVSKDDNPTLLRKITKIIPKLDDDDDSLAFIESLIGCQFIKIRLLTPQTSLRKLHPNTPDDAIYMLETLLAFDPRKSSVAKALEHPYMTNITIDVLAQNLGLNDGQDYDKKEPSHSTGNHETHANKSRDELRGRLGFDDTEQKKSSASFDEVNKDKVKATVEAELKENTERVLNGIVSESNDNMGSDVYDYKVFEGIALMLNILGIWKILPPNIKHLKIHNSVEERGSVYVEEELMTRVLIYEDCDLHRIVRPTDKLTRHSCSLLPQSCNQSHALPYVKIK